MPNVSIIIPILNEENYIEQCLLSVVNSTIDKESIEVLLVDGGSQDSTLRIVKTFCREYSYIRLLHNPKKIVPVAMNIGIKEAKGRYIIRLDAHADYPPEYFATLISWHQKIDADNIGTAICTEVKHPNPKTNAIKAVLSHPLGVGNSVFRTGTDSVKAVDTVPFGCYPREVFAKYGLYDERLVRNQDIELNKRIVQNGGKIYLIPDSKCTYYARETFTALAKNSFANGYWNILTAYYTGSMRSLSLRHFIPMFFVLSVCIPVLLMPLSVKFSFLSLLSLGSYLLLVIITSLRLSNQARSFWALVGGFVTLHLAYGLGSLWGLLSLLKVKNAD
jgi:glycosyltransferase involved in cell wall biosynthesis